MARPSFGSARAAYRRDTVLRQLVDLQYQRNDQSLTRARFRVRGDTLEFQPASEETLVRVEFFGDEVERITEVDPLTGELLAERKEVNVYPASHYVTPADKMKAAIVDIDLEMEERVGELEAEGRILEAARLRQRTTFDLEMMRELGFCTGIENYSRHLSRRDAGSRPWTLLDYFPPDWLLVVDESHMTIPQVVGMYKNDRTRKEILVDFGFRLPSALDNRPLTFEEFEGHLNQVVHMSATPGPYELERSERVVEQLIRPTGIVDPTIDVRPTDGQIDDLLEEIRQRVERGERALVTTLTKKMAEDLADYLKELGVKVQYLHSEVDTLERVAILRDLRLGVFDVLVGINLLREGIDLPEVTLVAILDADKEGFLRSVLVADPDDRPGGPEHRRRGRHVRRPDHRVDAGRDRGDEPPSRGPGGLQPRARHRADDDHQGHPRPQRATPNGRGIDGRVHLRARGVAGRALTMQNTAAIEELVARMETEMRAAAKQLEFERAAALRDEIQHIRLRVLEQDQSVIVGRAAERAARGRGDGLVGAADRKRTARTAELAAEGPAFEVTSVTVLPAEEEPAETLDEDPFRDGETDLGTCSDWLPGIRDEHDDTGPARPGATARHGTGPSRPTSSGEPAPDRAAAGADAAPAPDTRLESMPQRRRCAMGDER